MENGNISPQPRMIEHRFAENSDELTVIPDRSETATVDMEKGIKEILSTPIYVGKKRTVGKAITRGQINGILNLITQVPYFMQCGGVFTFDDDVATRIGGYGKGAILTGFSDGLAIHLKSNKDNNFDNFVKDPSCIGKTWIPLESDNGYFPDYAHYVKTGDGTRSSWTEGNDIKGTLQIPKASVKVPMQPVESASWSGDDGAPRSLNSFSQYTDSGTIKVGRGWVYMSVIWDEGTDKRHVEANCPFNAFMTLIEGWDRKLSAGEIRKEHILSTAFAGSTTQHVAYSWTLQHMVRKDSTIQIWNGWDKPMKIMYHNFRMK